MKRSRLHLTPPAVLFAFLLFFLLKYGFFRNLHFFIDVYLILAAFCFVSREKFEIFLAENTLSGKMNIAINLPSTAPRNVNNELKHFNEKQAKENFV